MGFFDNIRSRLLDWLTSGGTQLSEEKTNAIMKRREYRIGLQRRFIRVKPQQADDNLVMNFTGLAVDRSVALLFGAGIEFDYGEDESNAAG